MPPALRDIEVKEEAKKKALIAKLKESGVDTKKIPKKELEMGDGEIIRAHKHWVNHLESLKRAGRDERLAQLEDLKRRIVAWRLETAEKLRLAPATVMPEHLLVKVAYASAKGPLDSDALRSAGVRVVIGLVDVLAKWFDETGGNKRETVSSGSGLPMLFREEEIFTPTAAWKFAQYKPSKKTGLASWESSYNRYMAGEHPQTIAINPANGRAIQVNTVIGHILDGMLLGKPINLARLSCITGFPNSEEWKILEDAEKVMDLDVTDDGIKLGDLLTPIMGEEFFAKEYQDRNDDERGKYSKWCALAKPFFVFRRVGYIPSFGSSGEGAVLNDRVISLDC